LREEDEEVTGGREEEELSLSISHVDKDGGTKFVKESQKPHFTRFC